MSQSEIIETIAKGIYGGDAPTARLLAKTVLAALEAGGYAVVPVEPTEAMLKAEVIAYNSLGQPHIKLAGEALWAAMIAASQTGKE